MFELSYCIKLSHLFHAFELFPLLATGSLILFLKKLLPFFFFFIENKLKPAALPLCVHCVSNGNI